ncbi:hypothetical protein GCM10011494_30140 [Novosphingobium endophyticum]|uniref:Uncharacterized protein n=1 Tax=Novosphingobium endophyticum TaxID=1955250 RepID=A0A916TVH1_9SPHN|nr:hypothetical protein GCM10011494_30140 [Novosphingobium endophyticum]
MEAGLPAGELLHRLRVAGIGPRVDVGAFAIAEHDKKHGQPNAAFGMLRQVQHERGVGAKMSLPLVPSLSKDGQIRRHKTKRKA